MSAPRDVADITLPHVWRPRRTRAVLIPGGLIIFAALLLVAITMPDNSPADWRPLDRGLVAGTGLVLLLIALLLARPKIVATREGLRVVNLTRSRRLEWSEIIAVSLTEADPWATCDLADGRCLSLLAIQPAAGRARAVEAVTTLRRLVDAYGTATPPERR